MYCLFFYGNVLYFGLFVDTGYGELNLDIVWVDVVIYIVVVVDVVVCYFFVICVYGV